jgi:hypothetical protein
VCGGGDGGRGLPAEGEARELRVGELITVPLISGCQIPPPSNWQDLEKFCAALFRAEWRDPTVQLYGRSGQSQHGVDLWGYKDGELIGVQCKGIESNSKLSISEILEEVEKAKQFRPPLRHYILATTGLKDVSTETLCATLTSEHRNKGLFSVSYLGWNDLIEILQAHDKVAEAHFPFVQLSRTPFLLNDERSLPVSESPFSFVRPPFINPRIVDELQGYLLDSSHTVISVDLSVANDSNRFWSDFKTEESDGRVRVSFTDRDDPKAWFDYRWIGVSDSGTHLVWTRDCGGGTGVFHRILFLSLHKDTGLVQSGYAVATRERILLKILGSIGLGDRYYGEVSFSEGVLKIGAVTGTHNGYYDHKPFSLFIR